MDLVYEVGFWLLVGLGAVRVAQGLARGWSIGQVIGGPPPRDGEASALSGGRPLGNCPRCYGTGSCLLTPSEQEQQDAALDALRDRTEFIPRQSATVAPLAEAKRGSARPPV